MEVKITPAGLFMSEICFRWCNFCILPNTTVFGRFGGALGGTTGTQRGKEGSRKGQILERGAASWRAEQETAQTSLQPSDRRHASHGGTDELNAEPNQPN